jgi:hypothetical protein
LQGSQEFNEATPLTKKQQVQGGPYLSKVKAQHTASN